MSGVAASVAASARALSSGGFQTSGAQGASTARTARSADGMIGLPELSLPHWASARGRWPRCHRPRPWRLGHDELGRGSMTTHRFDDAGAGHDWSLLVGRLGPHLVRSVHKRPFGPGSRIVSRPDCAVPRAVGPAPHMSHHPRTCSARVPTGPFGGAPASPDRSIRCRSCRRRTRQRASRRRSHVVGRCPRYRPRALFDVPDASCSRRRERLPARHARPRHCRRRIHLRDDSAAQMRRWSMTRSSRSVRRSMSFCIAPRLSGAGLLVRGPTRCAGSPLRHAIPPAWHWSSSWMARVHWSVSWVDGWAAAGLVWTRFGREVARGSLLGPRRHVQP